MQIFYNNDNNDNDNTIVLKQDYKLTIGNIIECRGVGNSLETIESNP